MARILIVDDEKTICDAFVDLLGAEGHDTVVAATGSSAIEAFENDGPDLVFLDVQLPDMSGLDVLDDMRASNPGIPVIVITAHGSIDTAMQAIQRGAFDYLGKPLELSQIRTLVERTLRRPVVTATTAQSVDSDPGHTRIVGTSRAMQEIFKMVGLLTTNDLTVLITGESGVGKDMIARAIHDNGPRKEEPWVAVNCAAIPENLIESELFGHEKGAFTGAESKRVGRFESARGGTIFLDEISELPFHLQAKLLRVLQEHCYEPVGSNETVPVRARIIASTNRLLDPASPDQPFREDLYYRLSLVTIHVPPLRDHAGDIPELARHFLELATREIGRDVTSIDDNAMRRLQQQPWPGNVRELKHTIQRSVLMARGGVLTLHDLVFDESSSHSAASEPGNRIKRAAQRALGELLDERETPHPNPYHHLVDVVERALVEEALARSHGNQVAAAELLGINRTTLRRKC